MSTPSSGLEHPSAFDPHRLIISRPDLQPRSHRLLFGSLTLVLWSAWVWLWLPVASLLGWSLAGTLFWHEMIDLQGWVALSELLKWYAAVALLLCGSLIVWALYNLVRFRGLERRRAKAPLPVAALAAELGISDSELARWQVTRELRVHHDEQGRVSGIEPL